MPSISRILACGMAMFLTRREDFAIRSWVKAVRLTITILVFDHNFSFNRAGVVFEQVSPPWKHECTRGTG